MSADEQTNACNRYEQAWDDGRYHFFAKLKHPKTGQREEFLVGVLVADKAFASRLGLSHDFFVGGMEGRPLHSLVWFFQGAIVNLEKRNIAASNRFSLPSSTVRRLHGMSRTTRGILRRLSDFQEDLRAMNIPHYPVLQADSISDLLQNAVKALSRFERRTSEEPSRTDTKRSIIEDHVRPYWLFRPPALAYALYHLYREHSKPTVSAKPAYERIGRFENEFLNCHLLDPYEAVRVQVRTFKGCPQRKEMDSILNRLLTSRWFGEPD
jgi:hypothetical protein